MRFLKALGFLLIAVILTVVLNTKFGDTPPPGKLLNPFRGFWQNAEAKDYDKESTLKISGLKGNVSVAFDERMVPHIFADSDYDLYFAQGYITAKDRLWQMDFQTRFAAGRLSEVVGAKAIELDKYQRRMGMAYGAENMVKVISEKYPEVKKITDAYADGVNAYINSLSPAEYPIEFKILDYTPEKWTSLNSALLLKLMSATLAGGSDEFYMSNILQKFGPDVTKNLFPDYPFREDPIIPKGTAWNFKPMEIPKAPTNPTAIQSSSIQTKQKVDGIGSNNWAVSGSKSASGYPLLENDPHLDLTLPAIWYQVQLNAPGVNVYGVSIPGSPCVIIGYNQKVAWGVTNVGSDVLDWYNIQFKDASHKEYFYDNKWNAVKQRIEHIAIRGGETVNDTVLYTHHGPVVYLDKKPEKFSKAANVPTGHALRWIAHEGSPDVYTFHLLNRAKNYDDYRKALTYYYAPAQNFAFASVDNDIAITPNGYFPLKWEGQGKFLLDGSKPENDWHGRIPAEQNPTVKNPPRGFISSANQSSTDQTYPYYLSWEFGSYNRGHRINKRLTVMTNATVDSIRSLQNDNYSILAEDILPTLLHAINTEKLSATENEAYNLVKKWDKFYNADAVGASIFEIWQAKLGAEIWGDEFGGTVPMRVPSRDRTVELLLNEPNAKWYDNVNTPQKETRDDLVLKSFKFSVDSLQRQYGSIGKNWEWAKVKHSHVPHLAKIAGFGSKTLLNGGSKSSVNALGETNGPSWRMIVALGKPNKGFGVFPGGESGNPGSFFYDNMINTWTNGKLNELLFLNSKTDQSKHIKKHITLTNN